MSGKYPDKRQHTKKNTCLPTTVRKCFLCKSAFKAKNSDKPEPRNQKPWLVSLKELDHFLGLSEQSWQIKLGVSSVPIFKITFFGNPSVFKERFKALACITEKRQAFAIASLFLRLSCLVDPHHGCVEGVHGLGIDCPMAQDSRAHFRGHSLGNSFKCGTNGRKFRLVIANSTVVICPEGS